jgi:hypothetical protein
MVQLVVITWRQPRCHRLDALAIARSDQPRNTQRTHPPPRLVTQTVQEWLEPTFKLIFPLRPCVHSCADQSNKSAKGLLEPIYEVQIHSNGLAWPSLKHETEHGEVDEGCEGCGMTFKVPHQSSVSADPDEAPLDNPSS